jgi:hypothetical protein
MRPKREEESGGIGREDIVPPGAKGLLAIG